MILIKSYSKALIIAISTSMLTLTACQSIPKSVSTPIIGDGKQTPQRLDNFKINGKIGIVNTTLKQSGSAFYSWAQEEERFAIELQGAMGIGFTRIEYNGATANLTNSQVGNITADNPEKLLLRATGWQAPINQLPYWISGSPAPSDDNYTLDKSHRLINARNGDWQAELSYHNTAVLPKRIKALHTDGNKVTLIINHLND